LQEQIMPRHNGQPSHDPDPDQVITFHQWCELNDLSPATGERLRRSGKGPRFIQLSARRLGVTRRENRRWQDSRLIENAA
jgi:hypothetical protein